MIISGAIIFALLLIHRLMQRVSTEHLAFEQAVAERKYDLAQSYLDKMLASDPKSASAYYLKAELEIARDRPDEAMSGMRKALELGYANPPIEVLRAILLARAGKFQEAEPILIQAYSKGESPKAGIAEGLSRIFLGRLRLAEASKAIEAWMQADPLDDRPYLWRNEIDERIDSEPDVIILNYQNALKRNPTNFKARLSMAQLLMKANRTDEANAEFAEYHKNDPDNVQAMVGLGQIALLKGDTESAEQWFTSVLEKDATNITALGELAQIEIQKGLPESACKHLQKASELSPFDSEILYKYSQALKLSGDSGLARTVADKANKLKLDQDKIQDLRKAIVQKPDDLELRVEAAQWLINHGHEKEGLEWAELVLKQKPSHRSMCQALVEFYTKKQDYGLANYYESQLKGSGVKP